MERRKVEEAFLVEEEVEDFLASEDNRRGDDGRRRKAFGSLRRFLCDASGISMLYGIRQLLNR